MARFQSEAEVLAAPNEPRVAQIYELGETDGLRALVTTSLKVRVSSRR